MNRYFPSALKVTRKVFGAGFTWASGTEVPGVPDNGANPVARSCAAAAMSPELISPSIPCVRSLSSAGWNGALSAAYLAPSDALPDGVAPLSFWLTRAPGPGWTGQSGSSVGHPNVIV